MKILWRQEVEEKRKQKSQKENEERAKKVKREKCFEEREISVRWAGGEGLALKQSYNLANRRLVVTTNNNFSTFCAFGYVCHYTWIVEFLTPEM